MTQSDKVQIKAAMMCELTEVPRSIVEEELEVKLMGYKSKLMRRVTAVPFKSTVSDCRQRHTEAYKYDRVIGLNNDGVLTVAPLSAEDDTINHAMLLSDLKDDQELFFYCSAPVAQTSENRVRSIFAPLLDGYGEPYSGAAGLVKDARFNVTLGNKETTCLKCAYIQSYYGNLHNAYVDSISKTEQWALSHFEEYFKNVLTGESYADAREESSAETTTQVTGTTGKGVEVGTDFMDCVDKLAGGK